MQKKKKDYKKKKIEKKPLAFAKECKSPKSWRMNTRINEKIYQQKKFIKSWKYKQNDEK